MRPDDDMLAFIEAEERRLARFDTPQPSAAAIGRVKQAVLLEMQAAAAGGSQSSGGRAWKPWHGVLASAASIALAIWLGTSQGNRPELASLNADSGVSYASLGTYVVLDNELSELESINLERGSLAEAWDDLWTITESGETNLPG